MCRNSIAKNICYNEKCEFRHIKGTQWQKPQDKNNKTAEQRKTNSMQSEQNSFLDIIQSLKTEMLNMMETKLKDLRLEINHLKGQNLMQINPSIFQPNQTISPKYQTQVQPQMMLTQQPNNPFRF